MYDDVWIIWAQSQHRVAAWWVGEEKLEAALQVIAPVLVQQADTVWGELSAFDRGYFPREQFDFEIITAQKRVNMHDTPPGSTTLMQCEQQRGLMHDTRGT